MFKEASPIQILRCCQSW